MASQPPPPPPGSMPPPPPPADGPVQAPPAPPGPPGTGPGGLPWEDPSQPFLEALVETLKLFITRPTEAYGRMAREGGLGRPILYAVILGWIGIAVGQLYSLAMRGMSMSMLPGMDGLSSAALPVGYIIGVIVFAPVLIVLGLFVWSAIVHLFLLLFGAAGGGFEGTFRVMAYATTAQLSQIVPMCGGVIGFFWGLVLEIIGLAEVHETSQAKAAAAVLLPLVICCSCVAIVFAISGAAAVAALTGAAAQQ